MTWLDDVLAQLQTIARAPSAHNTQPATVTVDDDSLVIGWDFGRELVVGDPSRRDLWLSLGAFVESIVIVAAELGHGIDVLPEVDARAGTAVRLVRACPASHPFTVADLIARQCARGPYREPWVGEAQLRDITDLAGFSSSPSCSGSGAGPEGALTVLAPDLVDSLLPAAERWSWTPPALVAETKSWLRLDPQDPRYTQDGLSDAALALTSIQAKALRIALSGAAWSALRHVGGPRLLAASSAISGLGTVVAHSAPAAQATSPQDTIAHGQTMLRLWLAASRFGLAVHPLSVLIDSPASAPQLRAAVNATVRHTHGGSGPSEHDVLTVFRVGTPVRAPRRSARRPVAVKQ